MPDLSKFLASAHDLENAYEWMSAVRSYESSLPLVAETDPSMLGDIHEKIAHAIYCAARQADTADEFAKRIRKALSTYQSAKSFYSGANRATSKGRISRCDAMVAFLSSWLSDERNEKNRLLRESWESAREAFESFIHSDDVGEYCATYTQLALSIRLAHAFEETRESREMIVRQALQYGERAIRYLSATHSPLQIAKMYAITLHWLDALSLLQEAEGKETDSSRVIDCWSKAAHSSEETALVEIASFEGPLLEWLGTDQALAIWNRALEYCSKTRDRLIIGSAISQVMYLTHVKAASSEDQDQGKELLWKALEYAQEAKRQYEIIRYMAPISVPWPWAPNAYAYMVMAKYCETDPMKRGEIVQKGLDACPEFLERAAKYAAPEIIHNSRHTYGTLLLLSARLAETREDKKRLLEEAFRHEAEALKLGEDLSLFGHWGTGIGKYVLAGIKSELADLVDDPAEKRKVLSEAIREKEESVGLCAKELAFLGREGPVAMAVSVGLNQFEYGTLLADLFELSGEIEHLRKAAEALQSASETLQRAGPVSRVAECHWRLGLVHDSLADRLKASEEFLKASDSYSKASEMVPRLSRLYGDYAMYMRAWSEISRARYHHDREEYSQAKDHYRNAASRHEATHTWSYLASNYSAWAKLEEAEDLSRKEEGKLAGDAFNEASRLFDATKGILRKQLDVLDEQQEREMVSKLVGATDFRTRYCGARVLLEEARILDKNGDHIAASRKYDETARSFEELSRQIESEKDRKEVKLITTIVRAWQMMTRAEAEASPQLYLEASQLFEDAKDLSPHEKSRMLALGHSHFCKALEAGTRFVDTRDSALYVTARQHLETADDYYSKTGFATASEHSKATKLLLEAYMFMVDATRAKEQEERGRLYRLSEKVLEASAVSFMNAQQSRKREEVLKLLEKVREEKELATSLAGLLRTPLAISTTATFTVPKSTHEEAVGLERFEKADIRADLILTRRSLRVGERVGIGIDLVNAGKGLAQLVKIDHAIPTGFEVAETPEKYHFERGSLELRGKRLGPLKTEEVKLVVQPKVAGISALAPEIRYLDESGEYKTYKPEPIDIVVKEPHLPEWLKGPAPIRIPSEFRFETERTREVFGQLAKAFWEDYVVKGLFVEKAGWRSLMQLIRDRGLPRSAFYGHEGRKGPVLRELERLGLVEVRVFPEERGRGGEITKIRLAYETVILKTSS